MRAKRCLAMGMMICLLVSSAFADDKVLKIFGKGAAGDLENERFAQLYPEVGWEGSDELGVLNASDLVTVLLTKEAYDLYAIPYSTCNFEAVMSKKFAMDISADAIIKERIGQMYPFIQEALTVRDEIYGVPIGLTCSQWGYSPEAWKMVREVFPAEVPQTYEELFAFMAWWIDEGQYEFPQMVMAKNALDYKLTITQNLTDHLLDVVWKHRNPVLLSNPSVIRTYQTLGDLRLDELQPYIGNDGGDETIYLFNVSLDWMALAEYADERVYLPMPMAFDAEMPIEIPVDMRLFFVNPGSERKREAINYVSCFLASRDDLFAITAYDVSHEPIINPWLANMLEEKRQELAVIEAAQESDSAMQAEALANKIATLEQHQWLVSAEKIESYQRLTPMFFIRPYHPLSSGAEGNKINSDIQSFVQGRMDGEELLRSIARIVSMVEQENE